MQEGEGGFAAERVVCKELKGAKLTEGVGEPPTYAAPATCLATWAAGKSSLCGGLAKGSAALTQTTPAASSLCKRSGSFPGSPDSCPAGTPPSLGSLAGMRLGAGWVVKASSWVSAGVGSQWINPRRAWLRGQTGAKGGSTPTLKLLDLSRGLGLHVCFGGRPHSGIKSWVETWPFGLEQVALPLRISEAADPVKVPWEQVAGACRGGFL